MLYYDEKNLVNEKILHTSCKNVLPLRPKSFRGVCKKQTEIIPIEPDPDNTGVGIKTAVAGQFSSSCYLIKPLFRVSGFKFQALNLKF